MKIIKTGSFIGGTPWQMVDSYIFNNTNLSIGDTVSWRDNDTNEVFTGEIEYIMLYDNKVDVSINASVGRIPIQEIKILKQSSGRL